MFGWSRRDDPVERSTGLYRTDRSLAEVRDELASRVPALDADTYILDTERGATVSLDYDDDVEVRLDHDRYSEVKTDELDGPNHIGLRVTAEDCPESLEDAYDEIAVAFEDIMDA